MLKNITPQWWLGLLLGLAMPVIGVWVIFQLRPELTGLQRFDHEMIKHVNVQLVTFGMIMNAGLFFLFLKLDKENISQGILFTSVLYLIAIFVYWFL